MGIIYARSVSCQHSLVQFRFVQYIACQWWHTYTKSACMLEGFFGVKNHKYPQVLKDAHRNGMPLFIQTLQCKRLKRGGIARNQRKLLIYLPITDSLYDHDSFWAN